MIWKITHFVGSFTFGFIPWMVGISMILDTLFNKW